MTNKRSYVDTKNSGFVDLSAPLTKKEKFKLIVLLPLAWVRIVFIIFSLSILAVIGHIVTFRHKEDEPLSGWRRKVMLMSR